MMYQQIQLSKVQVDRQGALTRTDMDSAQVKIDGLNHSHWKILIKIRLQSHQVQEHIKLFQSAILLKLKTQENVVFSVQQREDLSKLRTYKHLAQASTLHNNLSDWMEDKITQKFNA